MPAGQVAPASAAILSSALLGQVAGRFGPQHEMNVALGILAYL
jgi:hypothetical protein